MRLLALAALLAILVAGCGGGDDSGGTMPPPSDNAVLAWDAPTTFADNTVLDPLRDLDYYEVYAKADGLFGDEDTPIAQVKAVQDVFDDKSGDYSQVPVSSINLQALRPFLAPGQHYLAVRAVGIDGARSDFSNYIIWEVK